MAQMGSRKFGSLLAFVLLLTSALALAALTSSPQLARQLPGGPYALLGALAVFFHSTSHSLSLSRASVSGISKTHLVAPWRLRVRPEALPTELQLLGSQLLGQVVDVFAAHGGASFESACGQLS